MRAKVGTTRPYRVAMVRSCSWTNNTFQNAGEDRRGSAASDERRLFLHQRDVHEPLVRVGDSRGQRDPESWWARPLPTLPRSVVGWANASFAHRPIPTVRARLPTAAARA